MKKFKTGNVIKTKYGHIEIVSDVTEVCTYTISFDSENVKSGHKNKTFSEKVMCWTCDINDGGEPDETCKDCKGTGSHMEIRYGMDEAKLLASNVKEYILKRLTKNFEF